MTHVGRYEIVGELGRGAMGIVYKASDPTIGRTVALKAIRLNEFPDPEERDRVQQRLWREARSAGMLSHPNIVTIHDVVEQANGAYIVMEFVNGQSLGHLLRRGQLPPRDRLVNYLKQVAAALDYAHQKGVIHRDVKPGNIIVAEPDVERDSIAKVADFGVAKFISQDTTHSGTMIGTPNYISPEQIEGITSDGRADQFSLAVVIYELLTGQKPFESENLSGLFYHICKQNPRSAELVNAALPAATGRVLARGLAKEPGKRFVSCSDLLSALEESLVPLATPVPALSLPDRLSSEFSLNAPRRPRLEDTATAQGKRKNRMALIAAAVAIVLGSLVATHRVRSTSIHVPVASQPSVVKTGELPAPAQTSVTVPAVPHATTAANSAPVAVSVLFQTEPIGTQIEVDDRSDQKCTAPCTLPLGRGRHTLVATTPGFKPAQRIFSVPPASQMKITLDRSVGILMMASEPSGSDVAVDGKAAGNTPVTLRLPAGPHQVVLTRGDQRHEEIITVKVDEVESRSLRWQ